MLSLIARVATRNWRWTVGVWLVLAGLARLFAPAWDDVTHDGDLAFLPADRPSVRAEQLVREAFPDVRGKSQIVVILSREDRTLDSSDLKIADRLASRFHNRLGARLYQQGQNFDAAARQQQRAGRSAEAARSLQSAQTAWEQSLAAWEEALRLDEEFAAALHNRALVQALLGRTSEAEQDRKVAWELAPSLRNSAGQTQPAGAADLPLVDVWNRHHDVFGSKLRSADKHAQLLIAHLANEFMATDNMRVLRLVELELAEERQRIERDGVEGLTLGLSGSAAVGGDMLTAAADSIRHTEVSTIVLVIAILLAVYRSPLLIVVPLLTIAVAMTLSTDLLALITQLHLLPGFSWWGFKIFKTTKIFIVVILFGSGTDFCLFLIARLREELRRAGDVPSAVASALLKVGDALVASAMTTVLGLGMMFFAEFGKFRNSGPAIGLCLLITLLACLTLSPALLCALGGRVFWPFDAEQGLISDRRSGDRWGRFAQWVVNRPGKILVACALVLAPLATWGWFVPHRVTYDLLSELPSQSVSTVGSNLLKRHFPIGEGGPVIVLARQRGAGFDDSESDVAARAMGAVFDLTKRLCAVAGVHSVRSIAEPLGDPPEPISLITSAGRQKLFLRQHALTKAVFIAQGGPYRGEVTRFELILNENPFSLAAIETLARIDAQLRAEADRDGSFWRGAEFVFSGTTAGIRDLRAVTSSDYWRITSLVTVVVFVVILVVLGRPGVCLYLIISVLFSYLVTIGATDLFFRWLYGGSFLGLDWKVPIFLFVILVAVGEDYNIYLVTRVFEEQHRLGPLDGLREAMARTGGIITSCGVIMAGSFVAMITGSLRGISELGFALTLGILLDTLIVRTVLVPAFLAILCRMQSKSNQADPLSE